MLYSGCVVLSWDQSTNNQEQRKVIWGRLKGLQELSQPEGDGLRLEEVRREVSGCGGKVAEAMLKRQESRMIYNTHYIGEKLKGLIDINYQVQFVAAQLTR